MLLVVTAVDEEARSIKPFEDMHVIVSGIGPVNAAAAVTSFLVQHPHVTGVVSAGIGGVLPGGDLSPGDVVFGTQAVFADLGIETPAGFLTIEAMGLDAGLDPDNALLPDAGLAAAAGRVLAGVPIATVFTCSGTDARAAAIAGRTGARVEAMEGAAVLQAAARLGVAGLEVRAISNTTGDRDGQIWDVPAALAALGPAVQALGSELA